MNSICPCGGQKRCQQTGNPRDPVLMLVDYRGGDSAMIVIGGFQFYLPYRFSICF